MLIKQCDVCKKYQNGNYFNKVNLNIKKNNKRSKRNCIDCEFVLYYYLHDENDIIDNLFLNKVKYFLNILLSSHVEFNNFYADKDYIDNISLLSSMIKYTNNIYMNLEEGVRKYLEKCKIYIGQTIDTYTRHYFHKTSFDKKSYIDNAIKKYGIDEFYIHNVSRKDEIDLDSAEIFCIAFLKFIDVKIYNIGDGALFGMRGYKHSDEQILQRLKRKTKEIIDKEAASIGYLFISNINEYYNLNTGGNDGIYKWKCIQCGEIKENSYHSVVHNQNSCRKCSGYAKLTLEDYHKKAEFNGWKFISIIYDEKSLNSAIDYEWECLKCNYVKNISVHNLKGCPKCAGLLNKTENDYHNLAEKKNFKWIGDKLPKNNKEYTKWQCLIKDHIWHNCYHSINGGNGCPDCYKELISVEVLTFDRIKQYIADYYVKHNKYPNNGTGLIERKITWSQIDNALKTKKYPDCIEYVSLFDFKQRVIYI